MANTNLQKHYFENNLQTDEEIVAYSQKTLIPIVISGIWSTFLGLISLLRNNILSWLLQSMDGTELSKIILYPILFFLAISLIKFVKSILRYLRCGMALTNKRVIARVGVISTESKDSALEKVDSVEVKQGLFGKILGYATIVLHLAGMTTVALSGVKQADHFKNLVVNQADVRKKELARFQAEETARAMRAAMSGTNQNQ